MRLSRRIKLERRQLTGVGEAVEVGQEGGEEVVEGLGEGEAGGEEEVYRTREGYVARWLRLGLNLSRLPVMPCSQKRESQEWESRPGIKSPKPTFPCMIKAVIFSQEKVGF